MCLYVRLLRRRNTQMCGMRYFDVCHDRKAKFVISVRLRARKRRERYGRHVNFSNAGGGNGPFDQAPCIGGVGRRFTGYTMVRDDRGGGRGGRRRRMLSMVSRARCRTSRRQPATGRRLTGPGPRAVVPYGAAERPAYLQLPQATPDAGPVFGD